jgi:hypothetical protein
MIYRKGAKGAKGAKIFAFLGDLRVLAVKIYPKRPVT